MAAPHQKSYSITVANAFPARGTGWEKLQHIVSIGGPIGWIPWVPATFASAAVAALCWWHPPGWVTVFALTMMLFFLGSVTATTSERLLGVEDPRNVVVDELAGQLVTFLFVAPYNWRLALAGFVLFRIFDITKPFPVNRAERLPAGWGIMADDILAGLYAAIVLYLLRGFLR